MGLRIDASAELAFVQTPPSTASPIAMESPLSPSESLAMLAPSPESSGASGTGCAHAAMIKDITINHTGMSYSVLIEAGLQTGSLGELNTINFEQMLADTNTWGEIGELFQVNNNRGQGNPSRIERRRNAGRPTPRAGLRRSVGAQSGPGRDRAGPGCDSRA